LIHMKRRRFFEREHKRELRGSLKSFSSSRNSAE
jgi:hypothetical protein